MKRLSILLLCAVCAAASNVVWCMDGAFKVTDISQLKTGDAVYLYCEEMGYGVSGKSGKDAIVSSDQTKWVAYQVTKVDDGVYLYDTRAKRYIDPTPSNGFYYGSTPMVCNIGSKGNMGGVDSNGKQRYLLANGTYIRMYTSILSGSSPFYMYYTYYKEGITYRIIGEDEVEVMFVDSLAATISIPESVSFNEQTYFVTSIGNHAFSGCSRLTSVTIGDSVTNIGVYAFSGCSRLTSITIPNSVMNIGSDAFDGCSSLPVVDNLRYADTYLVETVDKSLRTYTIKAGTKWIGYKAFSGRSSLTSIAIPNSVTSIEDRAFSDCRSLTSVSIPNSVTSIGYKAFEGCKALTSITIPNSVTSIGSYAFEGGKALTSITIPNSVTSIGWGAFSYCSSLTSITIPNSVTSISGETFSNCSSLTSITIPNSITAIGDKVFYGCSSLTTVIWNAKQCTKLGSEYGPFYDICSQITSFIIGEEVDSIPNYLCYGMSKLTSIAIPDSVTSIGYKVFEDCSSLTNVIWKAKQCTCERWIYYGPFDGICSQITSFIIGEDVESIPEFLCYEMNNLTSITIPNSVKSIGRAAFTGCSSLTSITIPNSVTSIGTYAFNSCSALTSITIPNSVTSIGYGAFIYCSSLTSITIPNSVTRIGEYAFGGCSRLTSVIFMNCTPPIVYANALYGTPSEKIMFVPNSGVKDYISYDAYVKGSWDDKQHYWSFSSIERMYALNVLSSNTRMGAAQIDQDVDCDSVAIISATANDGYYFVQWTDGNTDNPRTIQWSKDTTLTAEFGLAYSGKCGDNLYWEYKDKTLNITGSNAMYNYTDTTMSWLYLRDSIYSITLPQGITSIGNYAFSGCRGFSSITIPNSIEGKHVNTINPNAVYFANTYNWEDIHVYAWTDIDGSVLNNAAWPGEIATKADFTYQGYDVYYYTSTSGDYRYCIFNNSKGGTGNQTADLTWTGGQIYCNGEWHTIQIASDYETAIGAGAFNGCSSLRNITCLAVTPPTCGSNAFNDVPYDATLWCPCVSLDAYDKDAVFGSFKHIECIGSEDADITDKTVTVVPGNVDATFTWPITDGAETYTLVITKDGVTFCTLVFNKQGQLVSIAFKLGRQNGPSAGGDAPIDRDSSTCAPGQAEQTANGFRFTVTNLSEGTAYAYTLTVRDAANSILATYTGEFTTQSDMPMGIHESAGDNTPAGQVEKIILNGQVVIIRNGETYDMMGQRL